MKVHMYVWVSNALPTHTHTHTHAHAHKALLTHTYTHTLCQHTRTQGAQVYMQDWLTLANDGSHTRLQYDKPNTWSLKYNLLFQYILGLQVRCVALGVG